MKKIFLNRILAIESQRLQRQVNEPITFFDKESGMAMQVIGNGLVVPLPMDIMEWEAMVAKHYE